MSFFSPLFLVLVHADAAWAEGDHHQEAADHRKGLQRRMYFFFKKKTSETGRENVSFSVKVKLGVDPIPKFPVPVGF